MPAGPDEGGLWQIRVELFDAAGDLVDPEGLGIKWRVPESNDLTGHHSDGRRGHAWPGQCRAQLHDRDRAGGQQPVRGADRRADTGRRAGADQCGVMDYTIEVADGARCRSRRCSATAFATYSFAVQRGAVSPPEVERLGHGGAERDRPCQPRPPRRWITCWTRARRPALPSTSTCAHMATDGWSRQGQYDASGYPGVRARAMTPP